MPQPKSPEARSETIWFDGDQVAWEDARVHVLSHALHYGSSIFEGIRCYKGDKGGAVFRLREHIERFFFSARVLRMDMDKLYTQEQLERACVTTIEQNGLEECYIRPLAFRGAGAMGVLPKDCPTHVSIAVWPWGAYLGADGLRNGIDVAVSSYNKFAPNTFFALAKIGGAYVMGSLAKIEAVRHGYAEGILLDTEGRVAEGTGENIFAVLDGRLITPPLGHSVLGGITRKSLMIMAKEDGIEVVEQTMSREMLYMAEELFFTGTAAEVTPIRSVDGIPVGKGGAGPITLALQDRFFAAVRGQDPRHADWLTPVSPAVVAAE